MGLQDDWSRLRVRQLVQHLHEPSRRRLRLYVLAGCESDIGNRMPVRSPSKERFTEALSVAERFADGQATKADRRRAVATIADLCRTFRELRDETEFRLGNAAECIHGGEDWPYYCLWMAERVRLSLALRPNFESVLRLPSPSLFPSSARHGLGTADSFRSAVHTMTKAGPQHRTSAEKIKWKRPRVLRSANQNRWPRVAMVGYDTALRRSPCRLRSHQIQTKVPGCLLGRVSIQISLR